MFYFTISFSILVVFNTQNWNRVICSAITFAEKCKNFLSLARDLGTFHIFDISSFSSWSLPKACMSTLGACPLSAFIAFSTKFVSSVPKFSVSVNAVPFF
eukprot:TRINITY_DN13651_c0_g1_i1.p1 TRINITY_DN13651_c0_g1~~TRINITY_DN13651_c0_g1_i1.p1  ORF type:complete len:100 (+),score=8.99 TRINITY_DN13651_c0_g1_i1:1-300(+)